VIGDTNGIQPQGTGVGQNFRGLQDAARRTGGVNVKVYEHGPIFTPASAQGNVIVYMKGIIYIEYIYKKAGASHA
jgi:hypothetical protein